MRSSVFRLPNILANDAHYHPSCYLSYTKLLRETQKATVLDQLYDYIRMEIIEKKKIEPMVNVIEKYSLHLVEMSIHQNITKWEKQKLMELLKVQFEETVVIIPIDKTKLLLIPKKISLFDIAVENYHMKEELVTKKNSDEAEDRIFNAANLLREKIIEKSLHFHGHPKQQS